MTPETAPPIKPPQPNLTIDLAPRSLRMHWVSEDELFALAASPISILWTFCGIAAGAFFTCLATYSSAPSNMDATAHAAFALGIPVFGLIAACLGAVAASQQKTATHKVERLIGKHSPGDASSSSEHR